MEMMHRIVEHQNQLEERINSAFFRTRSQETVNSFHEFRENWAKMAVEDGRNAQEPEEENNIRRWSQGPECKTTDDQWLKLYEFASDLTGKDRHHCIWLQGVLQQFWPNSKQSLSSPEKW
jgi:hypothetical protein